MHYYTVNKRVVPVNRKTFQDGMYTETYEQHPRKGMIAACMVYMAVFRTFGKKLQKDLQQNPQHNKYPHVFAGAMGIYIGEQVKNSQGKQESSAESEEQFQMFSCLRPYDD